MTDQELEQLRRDVQYLKDRQDILDCIYREARGRDRHDAELTASCYWDEAFDEHGFPIHEEGASTVVPGLYFVGVHFLRKRKSSILYGIGEDATVVAERIARRMS